MNEELGYYSTANKAYANKYDALENAVRLSSLVKFHWDDAFWSKQPWKHPSTLSLDALYKTRALQLREKYDYIILCYSGGADSWNVLQTFDKNNIHLDEIVSLHDYSLTEDKNSQFSAEIFKVAIPTVEAFLERNNRTKFRLIDTKDSILEAWSSRNLDELILQCGQSFLGTSIPARSGNWVYQEKTYQKLADQGKKICLLHGLDKTTLTLFDNKYCFMFNDLLITRLRKQMLGRFPVHDEFFYWTKTLPELVIKQCHVIKVFLDNLAPSYIDSLISSSDIENNQRKTFIRSKNDNLVSLRNINKVLYGWNPNTFSLGKPLGIKNNPLLNELDAWAVKRMNEDAILNWKKIRDFAWQRLNCLTTRHVEKQNSRLNTTNLMLTQPYFIE
jgi:hypothetical protein